MPNWVSNTVIFKDPRNLFAEVNTEESEFDFDAIIPMPKDLNVTSPTGWYEGNSWNKPSEFTASILKPMLDMVYNDTISQKDFVMLAKKAIVKNHLEEQFNDEYRNDMNDRVLKGYFNYHRYGFQDWYDWHCTKWGCKWNASDTNITPSMNEAFFSTPWSTPMGIWEKLAKEYDFVVLYADEDIGSNFGVLIAEYGEIREEELGLSTNERYLLAEMFHNSSPYVEDYDDDPWYKVTDEENMHCLNLWDYYNNYWSTSGMSLQRIHDREK